MPARARRFSWLARWWVLPYIALCFYGTHLDPNFSQYPTVGPVLFALAGTALAVLFIFPRSDWVRWGAVAVVDFACLSRAWAALFVDPTPSAIVFLSWFVHAMGVTALAVMAWQLGLYANLERRAADG